ncbi:hypothetical protein OXX69_005618 [Metschnikowia pulcherrima]
MLAIRKKIFFIFVSISLLVLGTYHLVGPSKFTDLTSGFSSTGFRQHDMKAREQLHFSNYKFSLTSDFEDVVGGWDAFAVKTHEEKCSSFFKFLDDKLPAWEVDFFKDRHFDKSIVKKESIFKSELAIIKNQKATRDPPESVDNDDIKKADERFQKIFHQTVALEQDMADTMTIVRIFGHCFFSGVSASLEGELKHVYDTYSRKIIPFFHPEVPSKSFGDIETTSSWSFGSGNPVENGNLLDYYYRNMQGTGIVLSAATRHSREIVKFIHVLRALGNKLPIEILYRSDLSMKAKQAIMLAASQPKEVLLGDELTNHDALKRALSRAGLSVDAIQEMPFPQQSLSLINMQKPLSKLDKSDFSSYNNKILSLFFSSFENVLLFDTDAVPLLSTESLSSLRELTNTGAYFFRDRTLMDRNDWIETNYFAKLMPHSSYELDMIMGIKPVTNHTLNNSYMKGWRHHQEAGLVMLNKRRHFRSLLTLLTLTLWGEPVKSSIWGDKEMYWLAMSMAGDEDYIFNQYGAASVGELTSQNDLKHYNNTEASELCSSHPGHVSADGQLLWINSGFSYCKKNGYARDKSRFPFSAFEDKEDVKSLYENPLKIRHAISPPELPTLRKPDGSPDLSQELRFTFDIKKRKKDVDEMKDIDQVHDYNPQKGWIKSRTCSDYQYCAYDSVESLNGDGRVDSSGHIFEFDADSTRLFDILGAIWSSAVRVSDLTKPLKQLLSEAEKARDTIQFANSTPSQRNVSQTMRLDVDSTVSDSTRPTPYKDDSVSSTKAEGSELRAQGEDEVRLFDHSGNLMKPEEVYKNSLIEESPESPQNSSKIEFDRSIVRERPEKLNNDVKAGLAKLKSST